MDMKTIQVGDTLYYLDRNAWNVNDPESLIVKMDVIYKDGKHHAHAKQGYFTLEFELTENTFATMTGEDRKYLFENRSDAQAHYDAEIEQQVQSVLEMPKEELLQDFFNQWRGETPQNIHIINAMKNKVKNEFGVEL